MNLLCPNCEKMLTVAEEFSGQLMKCPLCDGTFTVPALPATEEPAAAPASASLRADEGDVYGLQEPPPAPPPNGELSRGPVPSDNRTLDLPSSSPDAGGTSSRITAEPSEAARQPAPTPQAGEHTLYIPLSQDVLRWVAPGALLLIFVFQMFPWVGLYPGGYEVGAQNAWGAAFGSNGLADNDLPKWGWPTDEGKLGMSLVTLFYLIPCFFLVFAVTTACAVAGILREKLPQVLWPIYPWRWAIALGANVLLLLILLLQLAVGFELESRMASAAERMYPAQARATTTEQKQVVVERGIFEEMVQRTFWLRLVVLLHLVAIAACGVTFWLTRRDPDRPTPWLAFHW
jgi:hypothetical protein